MTAEEQIQKTLDRILEQYERRIPAFGQFATQEFPVENTKKDAPEVSFRIGSFLPEPDEDEVNQRYFEVCIKPPGGRGTTQTWLFDGGKQELRDRLSKAETTREIHDYLQGALQRIGQRD